MKKRGQIFKKRIGSDRQTVWVLFVFGAILSLAGLFLILSSNEDGNSPAPEIVIRDQADKPPPPPGAGGYSLAPAQVERQVKRGSRVYLSSAQNRSGAKVEATVRFLPIERQARSGEALYSDDPITEQKGRKIIRLNPEKKELSNGEVFRISGRVLENAAPAAYGMLVVSFRRADSQPFSISSFVTLDFAGKGSGKAKALSLRAREEEGAVQFFLAAKNEGNSLVTPRVLFQVLENGEAIWESRIFGQGILPGMTREITSLPYRAEEGKELQAKAEITEGGQGEKSAALLYQKGRLLFEDGRIAPKGIEKKKLLLEIKNSGTQSFKPRVQASIFLANGNLLSLEKNLSLLKANKTRRVAIGLPTIKKGNYDVLYSLSDSQGLILDERNAVLQIRENIKRPSFLQQGYFPLELMLGLLIGLLVVLVFFLVYYYRYYKKSSLT